MKLTTHFTLEELTRSNLANQLGIDNTPPAEILPRLTFTAEMLERIRMTLGHAVIVTSGYRCAKLNAAVGSRSTSDHMQGYAADIVSPGFGIARDVARTLAPLVDSLGIGQIILEGVKGKEWVHVSSHAPEKAINRILTISDAGVSVGIA